jgi:hypothetical protein
MEPEGSSPNLQVPANCPYPVHNLYSDNIKDGRSSLQFNTTSLSMLEEERMPQHDATVTAPETAIRLIWPHVWDTKQSINYIR